MSIKIVPAHTIEAKEMADNLLQEMEAIGMPLNVKIAEDLEGDLETEQVRELLAKTLGWRSWNELCEYLVRPHETVYLDSHPELIEELVSRLSHEVGYDYSNGHIYNILMNAGIGYPTSERRRLRNMGF